MRQSNKQKQCVRIIRKAKYNSHSEPLFYKSEILPLDDLIFQQKLMFMHSIAHQYSPVCFPQFVFNLTANEHRYTFRNNRDFFVHRTHLTMVQKMPFIDFPSTWNSIDQSLKEISSKNCENFIRITTQLDHIKKKYRVSSTYIVLIDWSLTTLHLEFIMLLILDH